MARTHRRRQSSAIVRPGSSSSEIASTRGQAIRGAECGIQRWSRPHRVVSVPASTRECDADSLQQSVASGSARRPQSRTALAGRVRSTPERSGRCNSLLQGRRAPRRVVSRACSVGIADSLCTAPSRGRDRRLAGDGPGAVRDLLVSSWALGRAGSVGVVVPPAGRVGRLVAPWSRARVSSGRSPISRARS